MRLYFINAPFGRGLWAYGVWEQGPPTEMGERPWSYFMRGTLDVTIEDLREVIETEERRALENHHTRQRATATVGVGRKGSWPTRPLAIRFVAGLAHPLDLRRNALAAGDVGAGGFECLTS